MAYMETRYGKTITTEQMQDYSVWDLREFAQWIMEGLDIRPYLSTEYDAMQRALIRWGITAGVDVSLYANPKLSAPKAELLYDALKAGIDITGLTEPSIDSKTMIAVIQAREEDDIDLLPYYKEGYFGVQLQEIRIALKHKIDIMPYITPQLSGNIIMLIRKGLESGFDTFPLEDIKDLSRAQVDSIIDGFCDGVNILPYIDAGQSISQLDAIRLKLLEGGEIER